MSEAVVSAVQQLVLLLPVSATLSAGLKKKNSSRVVFPCITSPALMSPVSLHLVWRLFSVYAT